jgi:hypothetical protein
MPNLLEQQAKAAARKVKAAQDTKAKAEKERQANLRERRIKEAIYKRKAWLIGTRVVDAHEAGEVTPQTAAAIAALLTKGELNAADRELLADFMPPAAPVRPKLEKLDPLQDAAE